MKRFDGPLGLGDRRHVQCQKKASLTFRAAAASKGVEGSAFACCGALRAGQQGEASSIRYDRPPRSYGSAGAGHPPGASLESAADKIKKKRNKVRSAWISFVGRIVAQAMGAAATVALGLIVVQHYGIPEAAPASGDGKDESGITAATRVVSTGALSIAVLPLRNLRGPGAAGTGRRDDRSGDRRIRPA